jgi:outer membrane murein-binding lipoprotein Lpp
MFDDKWKERIWRAARFLLYAIGALYLAGLYRAVTQIDSAVRSMESNADSLQSDVGSIQDDVSSIQDDVSSIRDDLDSIESNPSLFTPQPATLKKGGVDGGGSTSYVITNTPGGLRPFQMAYERTRNRPLRVAKSHRTVSPTLRACLRIRGTRVRPIAAKIRADF